MGRRNRGGSVHGEPGGWVFSNGKVLKHTEEWVENPYATYIHRTECPILEDVPWLGDASPPEVAAGFWWDRLITVKTEKGEDGSRVAADIQHPKGSPFELLCHMHFAEPNQHRWLEWEFCPICVPSECEHKSNGDFVEMLNTEELAAAIQHVAEIVAEGESDQFSPASIFDLLICAAEKLRSFDQTAINLINETKEK